MPAVTRRDTLAMALGTLVSAAVPTTGLAGSSVSSDASLATLARSKGMRFGSAVSDRADGSFNDPAYAALLTAECSVLVSENELKWQAIRPTEGSFDFSRFDHIMERAAAGGLAMRGHNLLWQRSQWMPAWLEHHDFGVRPASEAARVMQKHIDTVCARYRGRIRSYDVVNEAVLPDSGALAQTALSRAMGSTEALLDLAFHSARVAAPDAQLVYNDYMSWEPGNEAHRDGVRALLAGFRKRGVPVDALGIQSHLAFNAHPQEVEWRRFVDDVVAMKFQLVVTELDVNDQALPGDIAERDRAVASYARSYLDLMCSYHGLRDIVVWGLCDSSSWLKSFPPLRADGLPKRPCLFAADYRPKPLRAAVAAALAAAPYR